MDLKVIRAMRDIHVPQNPEKPETSLFKSVQRGMVALVPTNFRLPSDHYIDLGEVKTKKEKKQKDV